MKNVMLVLLVLSSTTAASAQRSTSISIDVYQCLTPNPPNCVSPDEASKSTSCPDCKSWGMVPLASSLTFHAQARYAQPKLFVNDAAKQMYGAGLPKNQEGKTISVAQLYADPTKYGWVEIKGEATPKEGTIAVLPHTAGVVVKRKSSDETTVLYSSSKKKGAVRTTDLDNLVIAKEEPKYLVPKAFLEKKAAKKNQ